MRREGTHGAEYDAEGDDEGRTVREWVRRDREWHPKLGKMRSRRVACHARRTRPLLLRRWPSACGWGRVRVELRRRSGVNHR